MEYFDKEMKRRQLHTDHRVVDTPKDNIKIGFPWKFNKKIVRSTWTLPELGLKND